jgi:hypothetical protein
MFLFTLLINGSIEMDAQCHVPIHDIEVPFCLRNIVATRRRVNDECVVSWRYIRNHVVSVDMLHFPSFSLQKVKVVAIRG